MIGLIYIFFVLFFIGLLGYFMYKMYESDKKITQETNRILANIDQRIAEIREEYKPKAIQQMQDDPSAILWLPEKLRTMGYSEIEISDMILEADKMRELSE